MKDLDAQIGSVADEVAHPSIVSEDVVPVPPSSEKEIVVATTDPSPDTEVSGQIAEQTSETEIVVSATDPSQIATSPVETTIESSSGDAPLCSSDVGLTRDVTQKVMTPRVQGELPLSATASEEQAGSKSVIADMTGVPTVAPAMVEVQKQSPPTEDANMVKQPTQVTSKDPTDTWCAHAKGKRLSKKGEAFTLPSGEACIKIPNSVIEKNRRSWEPFVMGQFYSDPPTQGTLHNIVNGIWSKQYRDIAVSKMEGFAFLFRIPNAATRDRVVKQRLWLIEGQTMFVDKWEPGVVPTKPELTSAPIWLELRKVPLQFFNEDGLERIAGLVGHPKYLHPTTANKTNLEVAKVFTIIDPRKPLPEAVNVQFDSGEISRVLVSSPWMPPVCSICKEIGHVDRRCPSAPKACSGCKSVAHVFANCPERKRTDTTKRKTRRSRSRGKQVWKEVDLNGEAPPTKPRPQPEVVKEQSTEIALHSKLGILHDLERGETSAAPDYLKFKRPGSTSGKSGTSKSDLPSDSSDVESSDSELEEGEFSRLEPDFEIVRNKKKFSGLRNSGRKGNRGNGPKLN